MPGQGHVSGRKAGTGSQWVNRIVRTITTSKGKLVLHEAGLLCSESGTAQVRAVWAPDGADSTGIFAGAAGQGSDTAYPQHNTAAPHGTLTLAPSEGPSPCRGTTVPVPHPGWGPPVGQPTPGRPGDRARHIQATARTRFLICQASKRTEFLRRAPEAQKIPTTPLRR